jgi:hypothetical protein
MRRISCVKEQLLVCGKRHGVTALNVLVTLENRRIVLITSSVSVFCVQER